MPRKAHPVPGELHSTRGPDLPAFTSIFICLTSFGPSSSSHFSFIYHCTIFFLRQQTHTEPLFFLSWCLTEHLSDPTPFLPVSFGSLETIPFAPSIIQKWPGRFGGRWIKSLNSFNPVSISHLAFCLSRSYSADRKFKISLPFLGSWRCFTFHPKAITRRLRLSSKLPDAPPPGWTAKHLWEPRNRSPVVLLWGLLGVYTNVQVFSFSESFIHLLLSIKIILLDFMKDYIQFSNIPPVKHWFSSSAPWWTISGFFCSSQWQKGGPPSSTTVQSARLWALHVDGWGRGADGPLPGATLEVQTWIWRNMSDGLDCSFFVIFILRLLVKWVYCILKHFNQINKCVVVGVAALPVVLMWNSFFFFFWFVCFS